MLLFTLFTPAAPSVRMGTLCLLFIVRILFLFDTSHDSKLRNDCCPKMHEKGKDSITTNSVSMVIVGDPRDSLHFITYDGLIGSLLASTMGFPEYGKCSKFLKYSLARTQRKDMQLGFAPLSIIAGRSNTELSKHAFIQINEFLLEMT